VRLYNGSGTVLARATVSTSDPLEGTAPSQFYAHALTTPVALAAGTTYYIAADILDTFDGLNATGLTTDPSITFGQAVGEFGTGGTPTSNRFPEIITGGLFGPNFDITPAVPEPATLLPTLSGVAQAGVAYACRRRRAPGRRLTAGVERDSGRDPS
jgi:hypothetical protein